MDNASQKPGRDWTDRIHPLVWLEMLRSLRTLGFLICILLMLVVVVGNATMLLYCHSPDMIIRHGFGARLDLIESCFWGSLATMFLVVLPCNGYIGMRYEMEARMLDLIGLTRLRAKDVLFGKWTALLFQGMILACPLLPCLTVRYYLSRHTSLGLDALHFVELLMISSSMCACLLTIAASKKWYAFNNFGVMFGSALGWIPLATVYANYLGQSHVSYLRGPPEEAGLALTCILHSVLYTYFALIVGASRLRVGNLREAILQELDDRGWNETNSNTPIPLGEDAYRRGP